MVSFPLWRQMDIMKKSFGLPLSKGLTAGTIITTFTSAYIAASWYGWPMVFYAVGSTQLLSSLYFAYFGHNSPADHPSTSEQEVLYIDSCCSAVTRNKVQSTPWVQILTSTSFMALVLVQCSYTLGMQVLISEMPIYFSKVMELDIKSNGTLSSLPFVVKWFLGYLFSFLSDCLIAKRIITIDVSRKLLTTIGFFVLCIAVLVLAHCDKNDITIATILIVMGVGFMGAALAGYMVNHIDLSPNHAGTLMGIANQVAMMCSGIYLMMVHYVVTDETYESMHKGTIFSVFIWGNMTTQIFSGWLSSRYGGKWILVITNGICSILVLLLPTVIHTFGFNGFVTSRFFQGILVGFTSASVHSLLAKWAPPQERSSLAIIAGSGLTAGTVITTFTSGYIAASWYGWPMFFYALGTSKLLSSLLFAYYGYDSPADHPTISEQEVLYIDSCSAVSRNNQVISTPLFRILTSTSFMALVLVQCSYMIGMHLLKLETPIYFSKVMELDIKSNSTVSSLPFLAKWFLGYLFSFMSDWLIAKRILTMDMSRKMLITIGFFVVCIALLVLAHCDKNDITIATILIVIGVGFLGAVMAGFMVNHIDLSPNHAGTLMGIGNQLAMMCSGIALMVVQYVVTDETNPSQWMIVFYSTAAVFVSTTIVFNIFGSAKVQTWNDNTENTPI